MKIKIFSMPTLLISLALTISLNSCKKNSPVINTSRNIALDNKITAIKFFLKTSLNVTDDKVIYNTQKQEFNIYNLKYQLADIEKIYNEANEFKVKYGIKQ